ncbi:MAG: hypothetical protein ACLS8K_04625, partial [Lachnospira sp.]
LHRLISRIRVFFHFFSNLDYRNNLSSLGQTVKVRLRDFLYIIKNKETLAKYRRICYDTYTVRQKQLQKTYIYEAFADIRLRAWQMQMHLYLWNNSIPIFQYEIENRIKEEKD